MPTSTINLSLSCFNDNGLQISGFPPVISRGWTSNQPTVRTFTLTGEANTAITVPADTKLIAAPMQDLFNLTVKGVNGDTGIPLGFETSALGLAWVQPWNGEAESFVIHNAESDDQEIVLYFF